MSKIQSGSEIAEKMKKEILCRVYIRHRDNVGAMLHWILENKVVVPEETRQRLKTLIELLNRKFSEMIIGQPAIFCEESEYSKGYSKGYYDAKERLRKIIEELRVVVEE